MPSQYLLRFADYDSAMSVSNLQSAMSYARIGACNHGGARVSSAAGKLLAAWDANGKRVPSTQHQQAAAYSRARAW